MVWGELCPSMLSTLCVSTTLVQDFLLMNIHTADPPSNIDITQSDTTDDQEDMLRCVTDQSNPAPTITWVVETADKTDNIPEDLTTVETINEGTGWRKISTLLLGPNKNEMMKVHCIATIESLGFTKMSEILEIHPTGMLVKEVLKCQVSFLVAIKVDIQYVYMTI